MQKSTTIPISGDKKYKQAIKAVAAAKGMNMCDLVRKAVDAYCGEELKPHVIFFTQDGSENFHSETKVVRS